MDSKRLEFNIFVNRIGNSRQHISLLGRPSTDDSLERSFIHSTKYLWLFFQRRIKSTKQKTDEQLATQHSNKMMLMYWALIEMNNTRIERFHAVHPKRIVHPTLPKLSLFAIHIVIQFIIIVLRRTLPKR